MLQKARLTRIRMAKNASGAAFINSKKRAEDRMAARERGVEVEEVREDVFELQHHHLLTCLEKTTVRLVNPLSSCTIGEFDQC